jgi:hypothetical protein
MAFMGRVVLLLPLVLGACAGVEPPPQEYPTPHYDFLTQIRLSVADIEIDDSWAPRGVGRHVEGLAPTPPRDALAQMGRDRLFAAGGPGRAVFVVEDASIVRGVDQYIGIFAVRVDVADAGGNQLASTVARATRTRLIGSESRNGVRSDLYALVGDMMQDMNVELEYQLRRTLKDAPAARSPLSPQVEPVQVQPLTDPAIPPGGMLPAEPE